MSRTSYSKERGYRRLTAGVSLVLLCAGLAIAAHDVYRVIEYQNEATIAAECFRDAGLDQKKREACSSPNLYSSRAFSIAFEALVTLTWWGSSADTMVRVVGAIVDHVFAVTLWLGLIVTLALAALPWAVFYSVRWIARGFLQT